MGVAVLKSLLRSGTFSLLATGFSYLTIMALAHTASVDALSTYLYAAAWGLILALLIDVAADQCGIHFKLTTGSSLAATLGAIFLIKLVLLAIVVGAMLGAAQLIDAAPPLEALFFVVPAFYLGPVFEFRRDNVSYAKFLFAERLLLFATVIPYTYFVELDAVVYLLYFGISLMSLAGQFFYLRVRPRYVYAQVREGIARHPGPYIRSYWPFYAILVAQMGYGHFSRLLIERKTDLTIFAAVTLAFQLTNAIQVLQTQIDRHFRPMLLEAFHAGELAAIFTTTRRYLMLYIAPLAVAAGLISLAAPAIVRLAFGPQWMTAAECLRWLSPLIVTVPILKYADVLVVATRSQHLNLGLNVLMIGAMLGAMALMPEDLPVANYLLLVVTAQVIHIGILCAYLLRRVRRELAMSSSS